MAGTKPYKATLILDSIDQERFKSLRARFPMSPAHPLTRVAFRLGLEQALTLDDGVIMRLAAGERPQPQSLILGGQTAIPEGREVADTEPPPKPANGILEDLPADIPKEDAEEIQDFLDSIDVDPNEAS